MLGALCWSFAQGGIFPQAWKGATIAATNRFLIQLLVSSCLTGTPQGASSAVGSEKWKVLCIYSVHSEISDVISSAHFHNYLCGTTSCSHDENGKERKKKVGVKNKRKKKCLKTPLVPVCPNHGADVLPRGICAKILVLCLFSLIPEVPISTCVR